MPIKDIVAGITGAISRSNDPTEKLKVEIDRIDRTLPLAIDRKADWIETLTNLSKLKNGSDNEADDTKNILSGITKDVLGVMVDKERIYRYNNIRQLKEKIPIIGKALRITVDNILSPDDLTKKSLKIILDDDVDEKTETRYMDIKDEFQKYCKYLQLDKNAEMIISETCVDGDFFVEIVCIDEKLKDVYGNYQNVNLVENDLFNSRSSTKNYGDNITLDFINESEFDKTILSAPKLNENVFTLVNENEELDNFEKELDNISTEAIDKDTLDEEDGVVSLKDIYLDYISGENIISLTRNRLCLGYLYISSDTNEQSARSNTQFGTNVNNVNSYYGSANSNVTSVNTEKAAFDDVLERIYKDIVDFIGKRKITDIPKDLRNTVSHILSEYIPLHKGIKMTVRFIPESKMVHFKYPSKRFYPYGESYYADLELVLKMYLAKQVAATIYELARTGKHLIVYVDSTNTRDAAGRIQAVKKSMTKREILASDLQSVDGMMSMISTFENLYIPMINGKKPVEIDTIEFGTTEDKKSEINDMLKNILTGLDVPPSYLGVEEYNSAKATLSQESEVFARTIIRLQKIFTEYFTEVCRKVYIIVHQNKEYKLTNDDYMDVLCTFSPPLGITVRSMSEIYTQIKTIYDSLDGMGVDKDYIRSKWLPDIDWEDIAVKEIEKEKKKRTGKGGDDDSSDDLYSPDDMMSGLPMPGED